MDLFKKTTKFDMKRDKKKKKTHRISVDKYKNDWL